MSTAASHIYFRKYHFSVPSVMMVLLYFNAHNSWDRAWTASLPAWVQIRICPAAPCWRSPPWSPSWSGGPLPVQIGSLQSAGVLTPTVPGMTRRASACSPPGEAPRTQGSWPGRIGTFCWRAEVLRAGSHGLCYGSWSRAYWWTRTSGPHREPTPWSEWTAPPWFRWFCSRHAERTAVSCSYMKTGREAALMCLTGGASHSGNPNGTFTQQIHHKLLLTFNKPLNRNECVLPPKELRRDWPTTTHTVQLKDRILAAAVNHWIETRAKLEKQQRINFRIRYEMFNKIKACINYSLKFRFWKKRNQSLLWMCRRPLYFVNSRSINKMCQTQGLGPNLACHSHLCGLLNSRAVVPKVRAVHSVTLGLWAPL